MAIVSRGFKGRDRSSDPKLPPARYWVIDGKRQIRFVRSDKDSGTTVETRELLDVKARLKHMDELGTDIQVISPTLFLMEASEKPEINTAMRKSYNRWLGERCNESAMDVFDHRYVSDRKGPSRPMRY